MDADELNNPRDGFPGELATTLVGLMPAAVYTCEAEGRLTFFNRLAAEIWGREPRLGDEQERYCGSFRMWTSDGALLKREHGPMADALREGRAARDLEVVIEQPTGARLVAKVNIDPIFDREGRVTGAIGVFVDITERRRTEALLASQREALELALNGEPLDASLGVLGRKLAMQYGHGVRFAFYLTNAEGTALRHVVGMPPEYAAAVDGFLIGADSLTCGLAAATGEPVLTTDVKAEPRWVPWRDMAERFEYRGCWSFPIYSQKGESAGTFALYWREPRKASPQDVELAGLVTKTAGIIIARDLDAVHRRAAEAALSESSERLESELEAARALQKISTELISEHHPGALYEQLLDAAMALMKADAASVQMFEPEGARLRLLASRNFHRDSEAYWRWVDASSKSTCGAALATNARVMVEDVEAWPDMAESRDLAEYRRSGLRSVQSTPLIGRDGRRLGMLSTHWREPHHLRRDDFDLFDVLARQAADLIERSQSEGALRESEERFRQFARASSGALWIRDANTLAMEYVSPAIATIYGVEPDTLLGDVKRWAASIVPEDRDTALAHLERARQGEAAVHEFRIQRATDQAFRWIRNTDFPLLDQHGRVHRIGGIAEDVTEARLAVEHQGVLLAELQHRVRNIMAMVRSVTARTADSADSVEDYAALMGGRLLALARTQTLLTRAGNAGVDVETLIRKELEAQAHHESQYVLSGPEVVISPKAAEVLALAIHELTTNALKYGALSTAGGRVSVKWRVAKAEGQQLRLDWSEERPAPPNWTPPTRRGFGSQLIEQRVPYELGGRGKIDIRPEGVRAWIEFRLKGGDSILETDAPVRTSVFGGSIDMTGEPSLKGQTVLVLEDDFYLAEDTAAVLRAAGAEVSGPFPGEATALEAIKDAPPTVAVVDINLGAGASFEVPRALRATNTPFLFLTGYDQSMIPTEFESTVRLQKPVELREIVRAVAALTA